MHAPKALVLCIMGLPLPPARMVRKEGRKEGITGIINHPWPHKTRTAQGCQIAKFDPFPSLGCARVEGGGAQSKERKGSHFAA